MGRVLNNQEYTFLIKKLDISGVLHASPDWSQYDNHIYEELMVVACGVLEQCYNESEYYSNYIRFLLDSLIDKHVVLDSGHIYKLSKGLPSGHPLTSLINSVINWVLWSTIFNNVCKRMGRKLDDQWQVYVSGDDSVMTFPFDVPLHLFDEEAKRSGMKLDPFHESVSPLYTTPCIKGAHFLRRTFNLSGIPGWDASYIFDRIRFVEDRQEAEIDSLIRIENYILSAPDFNQATDVLRQYQKWLHQNIHQNFRFNNAFCRLQDDYITKLDDKWILDYYSREPIDDWILWSAMTRPPKQTFIIKSGNLKSGLFYIQPPMNILRQFRFGVQPTIKSYVLRLGRRKRLIGSREFDLPKHALKNILQNLFHERFEVRRQKIKIFKPP
jgi:hypothetical protein